MNEFIRKLLVAKKEEIVSSLLRQHHLSEIRDELLLVVLTNCIVEFNKVIRDIENINLETLRRQLRKEFAEKISQNERGSYQSRTSREYVRDNLRVRAKSEVSNLLLKI